MAVDVDRVGSVEALGLDETLFGREGRWRTRRWCTSIADVLVVSCSTSWLVAYAQAATTWLLNQPQGWRDGITWGTLDLSARTGAVSVALPQAGQVADPFHVSPLGQQQHRRDPASGPRHLGASRPQTGSLYRVRAVAHFGS